RFSLSSVCKPKKRPRPLGGRGPESRNFVRLLARLAHSRRARLAGPLPRKGEAVGKTVRSVIKSHLNPNIRDGAGAVKHVRSAHLGFLGILCATDRDLIIASTEDDRRSMNILKIILFAFPALSLPGVGLACGCLPTSTHEQFQESVIVFRGKLIAHKGNFA